VFFPAVIRCTRAVLFSKSFSISIEILECYNNSINNSSNINHCVTIIKKSKEVLQACLGRPMESREPAEIYGASRAFAFLTLADVITAHNGTVIANSPLLRGTGSWSVMESVIGK
jgi:hypothetical protein